MDDGGRVVKMAREMASCVSPRPYRSEKAEALLLGPIEKVERQLADAADPVDDLEGSADYKRHLIGVLLRRAFTQALSIPSRS